MSVEKPGRGYGFGRCPASAEEGGVLFGDFLLATQEKVIAAAGGRKLWLYLMRDGQSRDFR